MILQFFVALLFVRVLLLTLVLKPFLLLVFLVLHVCLLIELSAKENEAPEHVKHENGVNHDQRWCIHEFVYYDPPSCMGTLRSSL